MRFLRPDLIRWWLLIPVLVASWAIHWHATRAFRRRTPMAARFAALSRRSTWLVGGLWLGTDGAGLHVFNALDETGLTNDPVVVDADNRVTFL